MATCPLTPKRITFLQDFWEKIGRSEKNLLPCQQNLSTPAHEPRVDIFQGKNFSTLLQVPPLP